jgi:hypothetical protein
MSVKQFDSSFKTQHRPMDLTLLPNVGVFISNSVKEKDARYLTLIATFFGHLTIKEAFIKMNEQNPNQRLKQSPNLAFGRGRDCIWFSYCDDDGKLLTKEPVAALFLKPEPISQLIQTVSNG